MLRTETVGGGLILLTAFVALLWANSPWAGSYAAVKRFVPWPSAQALGLDLDLAHWAGDGLLTVFFFVAGLELKRQFTTGDLRDPRQAALPVVAAIVDGRAWPKGSSIGGGPCRPAWRSLSSPSSLPEPRCARRLWALR